MRDVVLIVHNVRSAHNVGSLLRTAEGLGVSRVYLTGYTPYPIHTGDTRLPHLSRQIDARIHKTSLGAEKTQKWNYVEDITALLSKLKAKGFTINVLEQSPSSIEITKYTPPAKTALVVGHEVEGVEKDVLGLADNILEIPMAGKKESFNVAQAAAMTLFYLKYTLPKS